MQDGDGNPMLSFGGNSQVIKVVRNGGNIVWTLGVDGDIEVLPPDTFFHQHALRAARSGYYLSLDNQGLGTQSRILVWWVDFSYINPRLQLSWQHALPAADYSPDEGNVDLLPSGGYVIGSAGGRSITELTSAGSVLWRAQLDSSLYRAYWVDDLYARLHPRYEGDTVVCVSDGMVPLRASLPGGIWSGAFVQGDSFNTVAAGFGLHLVTYKLGPEEFTVELLVDPSSNCGVGRAEVVKVRLEMEAFPNPVGEVLNLRWVLQAGQRMTVDIHGLDGRVLLQRELGWLGAGQHALRLTRAGLGAAGAVVVCLRTSSGLVARRIIVLE
jgi:hypothetical protein